MRIEFDPTLVEQAVVHRVYGDRKLEAQLHRKIDRLYELPPGRERDSQFIAAYADLFGELDLAGPLTDLLAELPIIANHTARCLIRESTRAKRDKAELLIKRGTADPTPEDRRLIVEVSVASLLEPSQLEIRMRREFHHVADMLDDHFNYQREEIDGLPSRQNLVRDRYRVLWDVYIEGRLDRQGLGDGVNVQRLAGMLTQVFNLDDPSVASSFFGQVYASERLTHSDLFRWSQSPELSSNEEVETDAGSMGEPGTACPLCGFPTFVWYDFSLALSENARRTICNEHPGWSAAQGACRQCVEIYATSSVCEPLAS